MPLRPNITIVKGPDWRKYIDMPHARMQAIGTVRLGRDLEGALVFDLSAGTYLLIDRSGARFELDYQTVRAALDALEGGG
jgi:hypothetical protein